LLAAHVALAAPAAAQVAPPSYPITVQSAVQYAVDNYAAVRASAARLAAQEANVDLTHTAYLPRLDGSLQVNRATRNNVAGLLLPGTTVPAISGPVSDDSSSSSIWGSAAGVLLSWEAFDFGQREASMDLARSQVGRATAATALTRLEVGVRTADAFLRLASAQETVRAARANVDRQQVFAGTVAALVANQLRPGADDSRAQAELAAARIQLAQAEQATRIARAGLAQWLGADPADVRIAADALLAAPPPSGPRTGPPPAHPLAASQLAAIASSQALQEMLGRSYFPRVHLQSAYALRGTGALANGSTPGGAHGLGFDTANWAVGVTATFPLLDRYAIRARTRIEANQERAERATYDRVVQELSTQTQQAAAEMEGTRQVAQFTPVQLQAARVLEQQSRARYDAGLATIVEVADAQRLLLQAEVGDAVARLGVWRALVSEAAAVGDLSRLVP
jgi:outer membrane protein TolC